MLALLFDYLHLKGGRINRPMIDNNNLYKLLLQAVIVVVVIEKANKK